MPEQKKVLGQLSMYGTLVVLGLVAYWLGGFGTFFGEFGGMFADYKEAINAPVSFISMIGVILATVVCFLPVELSVLHGVNALIGKHRGEHALLRMFFPDQDKRLFWSSLVTITLEELLARGLFLGLLLKLMPNQAGFLSLLLIGNGLWAWIHLYNYQDRADRNPLRVLSQFVGGLAFTYIFMKYGLLAAILAHFAHNAVAFASLKKQSFSWPDLLRMAYLLFVAAICWLMMDRPMTDLKAWLSFSPTFALPGWGFGDYVLATLLIDGLGGVAAEVLLYDQQNVSAHESVSQENHGLLALLRVGFIGACLLAGAYMLAFWVIGWFVKTVWIQALLVATLLPTLNQQESGSAIARNFWLDLPTAFLLLCAIQAIGFWSTVMMLLIHMVVFLPLAVIRRYDD